MRPTLGRRSTAALLAALSGVLLVLSFPKFGHPAFAWAALAPLFVECATSRDIGQGIRLGFIAGFIGFLGTLYWVVGVVQVFGGLPTPVAAVVGVLTAMYLSIFPALFGGLMVRAMRRFGLVGVWLAPPLWVATEWFRASTLLSFPWALIGSSQATVLPVAQAASVVGVYGLSLLVALVSAAASAIALSQDRRHRRGAIAVACLLALVAASGAWRVRTGTLTSEGTPLRVGLLQGNIAQEQKQDASFREGIMSRYLGLTRRALADGAELVIWPESSTPFFFDAQSALAEPIRRLAAEAGTPFIVGTDEFEPMPTGQPNRIYNTAVAVGRDGRSVGTYRKMHLVPFGEYVPMQHLLFFVGPLVQAVGEFSAGTDAVVLDAGGRRVSVAICYEAVFPTVSRAFVAGGSQLLATITNDAWFGRSSAAYQHFEQAGLRAIEQGRYMVRAANTGISGAVDPYGRVIQRTDLFMPAALVVDVRLIDSRTIYGKVGDLAAWGSLLVAFWVLLPVGRSRSAASAH